ncbi:MAG: hypothetical protein AAF828_01745 [Bacteroidota bacterium]
MKPFIFFLVCLALLFSCEPSASSTNANSDGAVTTTNTAGFEVTALSEQLQWLEKYDPDGNILESGTLENGQRQGTWLYYGATSKAPVKVETYLDGQLHGAYFELDQMGRLKKSANYKMNQLHGSYAEFRAGIPQITATYKDGQLDGTFRAHTLQNGKVNRTIEYKNGVQEGAMRWYNEQGELMQERFYRNGEVVN